MGQFGLLLPDVTQLPATFDVLLANLQVSWSSSSAAAPAAAAAPGTGC